MPKRFWIATPSFNSLRWLPCAVASVADQAGEQIEVHHYVQDGASTDGTREWLEEYAAACNLHPRPGYTFSFASAPDGGMYDAMNIAWSRAPEGVDFLAHLNSDEQYLPEALRVVASGFERHPEWEVLLADTIAVDGDGRYICHRRSLAPSKLVFNYLCGGLTASTFQRASVFQQRGIRFDTKWRVIGDKVWYRALYESGVSIGCCNRLVAVFTETGENLGWSAKFREEARRYDSEILGVRPEWSWIVSKWAAFRRLLLNLRLEAPRRYAIYLPGHPPERHMFPVARPTGLWRRK